MPSKASLLKSLRVLHLYVGVFTAPALCFFAFSGAMQTLSLHETTRGSSYQPPRWAAVMAQIHKKQTSETPPPRPTGPGPRSPEGAFRTPEGPVRNGGGANHSGDGGTRTEQTGPTASVATPQAEARPGAPKRHPIPLKLFFLVVSIGLLTSTLTGIYMAYKYNRRPAVITSLLIAGTLIPIALIFV